MEIGVLGRVDGTAPEDVVEHDLGGREDLALAVAAVVHQIGVPRPPVEDLAREPRRRGSEQRRRGRDQSVVDDRDLQEVL